MGKPKTKPGEFMLKVDNIIPLWRSVIPNIFVFFNFLLDHDQGWQLTYIHGCREWFGKAVAALLFWVVLVMLQARKKKIQEKCDEIVVCTASDQTTMESIVSAQQSLQNVHEIVQAANIAVLKIWSIFISKTRKV